MGSWILSIVVGFLIIVSLMILFDVPGKDNASDSCKDTSATVSEYRLCLATKRCHDQFGDNSALRQDCLYNVFYEALK